MLSANYNRIKLASHAVINFDKNNCSQIFHTTAVLKNSEKLFGKHAKWSPLLVASHLNSPDNVTVMVLGRDICYAVFFCKWNFWELMTLYLGIEFLCALQVYILWNWWVIKKMCLYIYMYIYNNDKFIGLVFIYYFKFAFFSILFFAFIFKKAKQNKKQKRVEHTHTQKHTQVCIIREN